jgi:tripartite ATP-independent transporter DctM subunit
MTGIEAGLLAFAVLLVLLAARIPIGVAMIAVGLGGYWIDRGFGTTLAYVKNSTFSVMADYDLAVIPLFLLMGQLATKAGMSRALFRAANVFLGHRRGGVAMASVGACAGFGAICGSSLATAATMAQVALPEMRRYGYSGGLSTGALAAGGTLGILIPPSVVLVIYAILTEQNIAKMFLAAMIPGILAALGYMLAIAIYVRLNPDAGPAGERAGLSERLAAMGEIWGVVLIFLLVIGGIYAGWFTPSEGAAVGAVGTGILAFTHGGMRWAGFRDCLKGTAEATAMIFLIILGAGLFNGYLALTTMPQQAALAIGESGLSPYMILIIMLLGYLALGCVMDSLSMILLTIPIFWPIVQVLDFGMPVEETAIWFGILALIVVEVGLITPPVGLNVFIINSLARDVPMIQSFRGVLPFLLSDFVRVAILVSFPVITLGLVRLLW